MKNIIGTVTSVASDAIAALVSHRRLFLAAFSIFSLPSIAWNIFYYTKLQSQSVDSLYVLLIDFVTGFLSIFGMLAMALIALAYLLRKETDLRLVLRSLVSCIGAAIGIKICQAVIVGAPLVLAAVILFLAKIPRNSIVPYLGTIMIVLIDVLFFFAWPNLLRQRLGGMRNASASISLAMKAIIPVLILISPQILADVLTSLPTIKRILTLHIIIIVLNAFYACLLSVLQMHLFLHVFESKGHVDTET